MVAKIVTPFLLLLARATKSALIQRIQYLQAENRILRSKLSERVTVTPKEKAELVRLGKPLGTALRDIISIVTYDAFTHWLNGKSGRSGSSRRGRPRTPAEIRELVLKFARENGWGYTRILAELKKVGSKTVGRTTVRNILKENGLDPGPRTGKGTWDNFIKIHAQTLWACDFFTKKVWTRWGPVDFYILFFIHVGTRKVHISGISANPDGPWMAQQAKNMTSLFVEQGHKPSYLIRDGDKKFTDQFDAIIESDGVKVKQITFQSPNLNAYAERWVQSIKQECLDHFVVFGEKHLRYIVQEYESYYNTVRPHQSMGNAPLGMKCPPESPWPVDPNQVKCRTWLGGVLRHYYRDAA
jgi:putative transposase